MNLTNCKGHYIYSQKWINLSLLKSTSLIILSSLLLFSYSKKQGKEYQIIDSNQILADINKGKPEFQLGYGTRTTGKVFLRSTDENEIAAFVDSKVEDNLSTTLYLLQREQVVEKHFELSLEEAEILFLDKAILINSLASNNTYLLLLENDEALPSSIWDISFTEVFKGYGLVTSKNFIYRNRSTSDVRASKYGGGGDPAEVSCKCYLRGSITNVDCDSGGFGTQSCSVTVGDNSCTANCADGFDACCNNSPAPEPEGQGR